MKYSILIGLCLAGSLSFAKLSSKQSMKCIYSDKNTETAFQDLQAAYGLRLIEAKVFFKSMDNAKDCPQLKKNLQTLRKETIAAMPQKPMKAPSSSGSSVSSSSSSAPNASGFTGSATGYPAVGPDGFAVDTPYPNPYGAPPVQPYPGADFYAPPVDSYGFPVEELDY